MPKPKPHNPTLSTNSTTLIHETSSVMQHRIVVIQNGVVENGEWVERHQIATHPKGYLANLAVDPLPMGIFRVQRVQHQSLSG